MSDSNTDSDDDSVITVIAASATIKEEMILSEQDGSDTSAESGSEEQVMEGISLHAEEEPGELDMDIPHRPSPGDSRSGPHFPPTHSTGAGPVKMERTFPGRQFLAVNSGTRGRRRVPVSQLPPLPTHPTGAGRRNPVKLEVSPSETRSQPSAISGCSRTSGGLPPAPSLSGCSRTSGSRRLPSPSTHPPGAERRVMWANDMVGTSPARKVIHGGVRESMRGGNRGASSSGRGPSSSRVSGCQTSDPDVGRDRTSELVLVVPASGPATQSVVSLLSGLVRPPCHTATAPSSLARVTSTSCRGRSLTASATNAGARPRVTAANCRGRSTSANLGARPGATITTSGVQPESQAIRNRRSARDLAPRQPAGFPKGKVMNGKTCPICGPVPYVDKMKRHVEGVHLPWYYLPHAACWRCKLYTESKATTGHHSSHDSLFTTPERARDWAGRVHGYLWALARLLNCSSLGGLLSMVREQKWYPTTTTATDIEALNASTWAHYAGYIAPESGSLPLNPPDDVAALTTSVMVRQVLQYSGVTSAEVALLRDAAPIVITPSGRLDPPILVSDSHCHLDTMGYALWRRLKAAPPTEVDILNVVCSLNFPERWRCLEEFEEEGEVYYTVGLHPRVAGRGDASRYQAEEARLLEHPRCLALGEVGLDHTEPVSTWHHQEVYLRRVLPKTRVLKRLVIHCREAKVGQTAVFSRLLQILREEQLGLDPLTLIYHHHFAYGPAEVARWMAFRPDRVFFGVPGGYTRSQTGISEGLLAVPLDRLLLESDAPYHSRARSPWELHNALRELGSLLNMPPQSDCPPHPQERQGLLRVLGFSRCEYPLCSDQRVPNL